MRRPQKKPGKNPGNTLPQGINITKNTVFFSSASVQFNKLSVEMSRTSAPLYLAEDQPTSRQASLRIWICQLANHSVLRIPFIWSKAKQDKADNSEDKSKLTTEFYVWASSTLEQVDQPEHPEKNMIDKKLRNTLLRYCHTQLRNVEKYCHKFVTIQKGWWPAPKINQTQIWVVSSQKDCIHCDLPFQSNWIHGQTKQTQR